MIKRAKVRDRGADDGDGGERVAFPFAILPKWARRTTSLDALLLVLTCAVSSADKLSPG